MSDRKRFEQAREQGRVARRAGKRRNDYPYRGATKLVRELQEYWQMGWDAEDEARKQRAAA